MIVTLEPVAKAYKNEFPEFRAAETNHRSGFKFVQLKPRMYTSQVSVGQLKTPSERMGILGFSKLWELESPRFQSSGNLNVVLLARNILSLLTTNSTRPSEPRKFTESEKGT